MIVGGFILVVYGGIKMVGIFVFVLFGCIFVNIWNIVFNWLVDKVCNVFVIFRFCILR